MLFQHSNLILLHIVCCMGSCLRVQLFRNVRPCTVSCRKIHLHCTFVRMNHSSCSHQCKLLKGLSRLIDSSKTSLNFIHHGEWSSPAIQQGQKPNKDHNLLNHRKEWSIQLLASPQNYKLTIKFIAEVLPSIAFFDNNLNSLNNIPFYHVAPITTQNPIYP